MDQNLQRLVSELRKETCPPEVLDRVARCISRERAGQPPKRMRFAWAVAGLVLLAAAATWQTQSRRTADLAARAQADRARVMQQAKGALAFIGHRLLEAAAHTENAILKEAAPPLRQGFETAKNKVTNQI